MNSERQDRDTPESAVNRTLPTRKIGRSQVEVSIMGMGTAPLGGLFEASSDKAALRSIKAAIEGGITHFDTAPAYGMGLAEARLGLALKTLECTVPVISTKVGRILVKDQRQANALWVEEQGTCAQFDFSYDGIMKSVEDSLSRSGLSAFDIIFVHDPDRFAKDTKHLSDVLAESFSALDQLRQRGLTRAIGVGVNSAEPCHIAVEVGDWDCFMLAGRYSVLSQEDNGLLNSCLGSGTSVISAAPFLSGVLAGGDHWRYGPIPQRVKTRVAQLNDLCASHCVPLKAAALQFPLFHPVVCNVMTGMRSVDEVRQNLSYLETRIPQNFWEDLIKNHFIAPAHAVHIPQAF